MNKKNKIMLILCSVFVCIASVLSFLPFIKNDDGKVYANTINTGYTFTGGSYYIFLGLNDSTTDRTMITNSNRLIRSINGFSVDNNFVTNARFYISYFGYDYGLRNDGNPNVGSDATGLYYKVVPTKNVDIGSNWYREWFYAPIYYQSNTFVGYAQLVFTASNMELNPNDGLYYPYFTELSYCWIGCNFYGTDYRYFFYYYDVDGNVIGYEYDIDNPDNVTALGYSDIIAFNERFYYFNNNSLTNNQYYNQGYSAGKNDGYSEGLNTGKAEGYNNGYDQGYSAGQSDGYNSGYNKGQSNGYSEGYNVGENIGYNNGYTAGMEDSNQYSFLNLISATIDAPVSYFQSLFNFELLGVNLQGFLTGLFTLCVVITIFKLCLGG